MDTIITTKLFVPQPTPGLVARPRLMALLDGILNNKLTLVSAQAGFGKTTLIVQWIYCKQPPLPTAWLSLEAAENDPSRFWDYVITSLQAIFPDVGKEALVYLHSSEPVPIDSTLTSLVNDLALIHHEFILVLDDYQFIQSEAVHHGIIFLIEHLPPHMHLVIATRTDPPIPLTLYRGKGILLEIRSEDLRFTRVEAASLLAEMTSPQLSESNLERLNERAEGWVVGLKMAGLAMRGQVEVNSFISGFTGSQRYIMDYLVDEVLLRQPPEVVDFLLKTSVLERFRSQLCDAVTQSNRSRQTISVIEKANLFLIPLDTTGEWYRYHHLFRDLLLHRLRVESGNEVVNNLHRLASQWYEGENFLEAAINHSLTAQDWPRAIELICIHSIQLQRVAAVTLLRWLQQIPESLLKAHELIYFNYIWALFYSGDIQAVERCLKYLDTVHSHDRYTLGRITNIRACLAGVTDDWREIEVLARQAMELLNPKSADKPSMEYFGDYASASLLVGIADFNRGDFDQAEPFFQQALEFTRASGLEHYVGQPLGYLGLVAVFRGQLRYAVNLIENAIRPYEGDPANVMSHNTLGFIYYEWNNLEASTFHHEQVLKLSRLSTHPNIVLANNYLNLARTMIARGEVDLAMEALETADRIIPDNPEDKAISIGYHIAVNFLLGNTKPIAKWLDSLAELEMRPWGLPVVTHYLLFLRMGNIVARQAIRKSSEQWATKARGSLQIQFQITWAMLFVDEMNTSMKHLTQALTLGKPEGFVRSFVDFGMAIAPLLREAVSRGIEAEYARKLLNIIEIEEYQRKLRKPGTSPSDKGLLSRREMEVLRLMAEGLSNQQISNKLMISLNTAKTHVYRVFDKLDANDRLAAVNRARDLNLIK